VERGNAVAVNQILNTRARLIEIERKIKETEELEGRLEALEQAQGRRSGVKRPWCARNSTPSSLRTDIESTRC
jgi:hypothetical protein